MAGCDDEVDTSESSPQAATLDEEEAEPKPEPVDAHDPEVAPPQDVDLLGADAQPSRSSDPYPHVLRDLVPVGAAYPIADTWNAPDGKRYVMQSSVSDDGTGLVAASGVITVDNRNTTTVELADLAAGKVFVTGPALEKIQPPLQQLLAAVGGSTPVALEIDATVAYDEGLHWKVLKEIARGNIITYQDYDDVETSLRQAKRVSDQAAIDIVAAEVVARGGTVTAECEGAACLFAQLPADQVAGLASLASVAVVDTNSAAVRDATITSIEIAAGSQYQQFINSGYDGENGAASDLTVAILEQDEFWEEHPLFREAGAITSPRIWSKWLCSVNSCSTVANYPPVPAPDNPYMHATMMAAIIFGDLRDAQDPAIASTTLRAERSGFAPEAWANLYKFDAGSSPAGQAMLNIIDTDVQKPRIANMSQSISGNDLSCYGQSPINRRANDMFAAGTLLFKSAGNTGHVSATACTVGSPGAAIGVFTVGSHGTSFTGTTTDVRTGVISTASARGGYATASGSAARGRSVIDLTAHGARGLLPKLDGTYNNGLNAETSPATATVTAGALEFIDMWHRVHPLAGDPYGGTFIDTPGNLFVAMLLQGDRQGPSAKLVRGFDNLFGAGRVKLRMKNGPGMDAPAQWNQGIACVQHGKTQTIKINLGNLIGSAADDIKVVLYWFDRNHEVSTGMIDDFDLSLHTTSGTQLGKSNSATDNKERVYYSAAGNKQLEFRIHGYDVRSDNVCGLNSQYVYWGYFYEDRQRDDPEGPFAANVEPEGP